MAYTNIDYTLIGDATEIELVEISTNSSSVGTWSNLTPNKTYHIWLCAWTNDTEHSSEWAKINSITNGTLVDTNQTLTVRKETTDANTISFHGYTITPNSTSINITFVGGASTKRVLIVR